MVDTSTVVGLFANVNVGHIKGMDTTAVRVRCGLMLVNDGICRIVQR